MEVKAALHSHLHHRRVRLHIANYHDRIAAVLNSVMNMPWSTPLIFLYLNDYREVIYLFDHILQSLSYALLDYHHFYNFDHFPRSHPINRGCYLNCMTKAALELEGEIDSWPIHMAKLRESKIHHTCYMEWELRDSHRPLKFGITNVMKVREGAPDFIRPEWCTLDQDDVPVEPPLDHVGLRHLFFYLLPDLVSVRFNVPDYMQKYTSYRTGRCHLGSSSSCEDWFCARHHGYIALDMQFAFGFFMRDLRNECIIHYAMQNDYPFTEMSGAHHTEFTLFLPSFMI